MAAVLSMLLKLPKTELRALKESKIKSLAKKYDTIPAQHRGYYPPPPPVRPPGRPVAAEQAAPAPPPKPSPKRGPGRPRGGGAQRKVQSKVIPGQPTLSAFMSAPKRQRVEDEGGGQAEVEVIDDEEEEEEELSYDDEGFAWTKGQGRGF
jgi:hypothetical protein